MCPEATLYFWAVIISSFTRMEVLRGPFCLVKKSKCSLALRKGLNLGRDTLYEPEGVLITGKVLLCTLQQPNPAPLKSVRGKG